MEGRGRGGMRKVEEEEAVARDVGGGAHGRSDRPRGAGGVGATRLLAGDDTFEAQVRHLTDQGMDREAAIQKLANAGAISF